MPISRTLQRLWILLTIKIYRYNNSLTLLIGTINVLDQLHDLSFLSLITSMKEVGYGNDSDSEGQMVDGILSSGTVATYELPSQEDLIRSAFAGDDVEDDFEKNKQEVLNEENPEPEKPILLPGWGQWTHIQQKKGLPSWMLEEHENAKKKREEVLKKRKDANLKHVIISEKVDKKVRNLEI